MTQFTKKDLVVGATFEKKNPIGKREEWTILRKYWRPFSWFWVVKRSITFKTQDIPVEYLVHIATTLLLDDLNASFEK